MSSSNLFLSPLRRRLTFMWVWNTPFIEEVRSLNSREVAENPETLLPCPTNSSPHGTRRGKHGVIRPNCLSMNGLNWDTASLMSLDSLATHCIQTTLKSMDMSYPLAHPMSSSRDPGWNWMTRNPVTRLSPRIAISSQQGQMIKPHVHWATSPSCRMSNAIAIWTNNGDLTRHYPRPNTTSSARHEAPKKSLKVMMIFVGD